MVETESGPCVLSYQVNRLVMNRHLYGPRHGPRLGDIKGGLRLYRIALSFAYTNITASWSAKIINDKLYLHSVMVFHSKKVEPGGVKLPKFWVKCFALSQVCCHLKWDDSPQGYEYPLHSFSSAIDSWHVRLCPVCLTNCRMRTTKPSTGDDWSIEIDSWHNLGACRPRQDPEWRNNLTVLPGRILVPRMDMCGPGAVYRAWMEDNPISASAMETTEFMNLREYQ